MDNIKTKNRLLTLNNTLAFLFLLLVFQSAFFKIRDVDAWQHLSLGKLIWQLKGLPAKEPLSYTLANEAFSYSSWLFGVIYYLTYLLFNATGLVLLKTTTITVAFFILLKDTLTPYKNYALAISLLPIVLMLSIVTDRFAMRPDSFFILFLSFSIFSLNAYLFNGKKYIYTLPLVHMIWSNSHSSVNVMFVPFLSFIFGGLIQYYLSQKGTCVQSRPTPSEIKIISLIFLLSFIAALISPYFTGQFFHGSQYLESQWYKSEIIELLPPGGKLLTSLVILGSIILSSFLLTLKNFSFIHFFLILPFLALPFFAQRFCFLMGIVGIPVLVRNLSRFIEKKGWAGYANNNVTLLLTAIWIISFSLLSMNNVSPFGKRKNLFGTGFHASAMPVKAVEFMDKNEIYGRVLNPFHFGQYVIWSGYPKRTVFTDSRADLPADLMEKLISFYSNNTLLDELFETYGFDSILSDNKTLLTQRSVPGGKINPAFYHKEWALVYWDDVSNLYLKRGGPYDHLIKNHEYIHIKPDTPFSYFSKKLVFSPESKYLERELKRNINETDSTLASLFLGLMYNSNGRYRETVLALTKTRNIRYSLGGYFNAIIGDAFSELGDLDKSLHYYQKGLEFQSPHQLLYRIGTTYSNKGDYKNAIKHFSKALGKNSKLKYIYPDLISAYMKLGKVEKAEKLRIKYLKFTSE